MSGRSPFLLAFVAGIGDLSPPSNGSVCLPPISTRISRMQSGKTPPESNTRESSPFLLAFAKKGGLELKSENRQTSPFLRGRCGVGTLGDWCGFMRKGDRSPKSERRLSPSLLASFLIPSRCIGAMRCDGPEASSRSDEESDASSSFLRAFVRTEAV